MSGPKIPTKQWAQVIDKVGGPLQYKQIDVPKPGPTDVLVNIKYSGVCHTDLHALNGDWPIPTKLPLVGGHEGAGIVVARGELVTDEDAKIGEAVGVKWLNDSCLSCTFCQQADEPLCLKPKLSGYLVDGSFQQYCVAGARHVARIPEGIPLDEVAPVLCAGITVYKGLKESGARPGQTVAIVGAGGGLGSLAQQYAKAMGLQVIAIDTGKEKEEMSMKMGASVSFEIFVIFSSRALANMGTLSGIHRLCQVIGHHQGRSCSHQGWPGTPRRHPRRCDFKAIHTGGRIRPAAWNCRRHRSTSRCQD
jgi:alcohol dehydrogenase, propanol-preferring